VVPESARWDRIFPPEDPADAEHGAAKAGGGARPEPLSPLAGALRDLERENPVLRDLFPRDLSLSPRRSSPPAGGEERGDGREGLSLRDLGHLLRDLSSREAARLFMDLEEDFERRPGPELPWLGSAGGRKGGNGPPGVPVPRGVVDLVAAMLEPYRGRFYDPRCGSAEFLAGAADFVTGRQGNLADLAFYAQESNRESWRLARMNLMVRGIDTAGLLWNPDSPLRRDPHRDLKFDFVAVYPPPADNPYHWIPYALDRLSPTGLGALLLPKGSLSSSREGERELRRTLVESRLVDCVVNLPPRIFGVSLPRSSVWFLSKAKTSRGRRADELLFIDARRVGRALGRRRWEFSADDIGRLARTYHNWRFPKAAPYRDIRHFAVSVYTARIREEGYNLNPALYLGIPETEEDTGRGAHFAALRAEFEELVREEGRLSRQVTESLRKIRFED
jgi:type I restriction enzyme M protein